MRIDAVGFDMDGTLYSHALMSRLSVPLLVRHPRVIYHFSRVRRDVRRLDRIEGFRRTQATLLAARLGIDAAEAGALIERVIYGEWISLLRGIRPFPLLRTALAQLRAMGLRLGLMSDYPVERKLGFLGLQGLWDASFCSEETGYLKPHPNPFRRLARELGTEPSRVLYVGDSVAYDVRGAAAVGMHTALIGREDSASEVCFRSYARFAELVEKRFG